MKMGLFVLGFALMCCQGQQEPTEQFFTPETAAGLWVPYEVKNDIGTVEKNRNNLIWFDFFAPYTGSVKLNPDGTYIPFLWSDNGEFGFLDNQAGSFDLAANQLLFSSPGNWEIDFELVKFTGNELWLRGVNYQVKFKRLE
jgi:hypothetical protein